jgi:hypothetical protein
MPNFELRFCRIVDLKVIYIQKIYFEFLETFKYYFQFFSKTKLTRAREPFVVFAYVYIYTLKSYDTEISNLSWSEYYLPYIFFIFDVLHYPYSQGV